MVMVSLSDKTTYKKLAPGEQSLTNATDLTFADLAEASMMARGTVSADQKSVPALQIIVMTKGDLAKQEAERLEWRRGILGVITALKPDTKEITISNRTMAGTQAVVIPISDKTEMRRYAPDSIKFGDAKPSSFDLKVGDQLRALDHLRIHFLQSAKGRDWKFPHSRGRRVCCRSRNRRNPDQGIGEEDSTHNRYQTGRGFAALSLRRWERWVWPVRVAVAGQLVEERSLQQGAQPQRPQGAGGPGGGGPAVPVRWRLQYQRHA